MNVQKIFGSGEMAELIRRTDWSLTPLGPLSDWPEALRTTVNMILCVPTPMQVFWGPEMTLLYNDAMRPFLEGKHPLALGQPAHIVWSEAWQDVGEQMRRVYTEGRSYAYENLPLTLLLEGRPQQMHWTFSYSPLYASDGTVAGLLNVTQNTTDTYRAQLALRASERRFRTLVDNASVGIAIGNTHGQLTYVNPTLRTMLGYSAEEVLRGEVRWDRLTPARYAELDALAVRQMQQTGVAEPYEKAYCTKTGEAVPLLIGATVLPSEEGADNSGDMAVFATDLRNQKRAEGALIQSEKLAAVGKLASSISHEINNPLEAVTNLLYIVRQDPNLAQSSRDFLETADRELARVSQVTSQTLRFHRQSTAARTLPPESLVDEVLQLYGARLSNFGIKVRREYQPNVLVTCYEGDIRQVLNNIVGNAVDAMRSGGRLVIRTRIARRWSNSDEGVLISIADTGSGMSHAVQQRIFDAFFTTKGNNGTGLGLWISQSIIHKHRGYLRAHSSTSTVHHGTLFHLWLPLQLASTAREPWHAEESLAALAISGS